MATSIQHNTILTLLILTAALLLNGCSSRTVVESDLNIKGAPDWVNEGSQALSDGKKRFFRGIGSAEKMPDFSLQKSTADNRARAELAQTFSSFMNVISNDYSNNATDAIDTVSEQSIARTVKNMTQINLSGAEIIARWRDKKTGRMYSLAEIDMNKVKTITSAAKNMDASFKSFFANQSDNIFDSISNKE